MDDIIRNIQYVIDFLYQFAIPIIVMIIALIVYYTRPRF